MPEFVEDEEFVEKERPHATGPRGPRKRSEEQSEWDEAFGNAFASTGFLHAQLQPNEVADARKYVASAARLYERATTEGQARPGKVKGTVLLSWKIRTPVKRKAKSETSSEEETSE